MKHVMAILAGPIVASGAPSAKAEPGVLESLGQGKRLSWQFSPATTLHYTYDSAHKPVVMVGLERESPSDGGLDGVALFTNSFGQPTLYMYPWGGVHHGIFGIDKLSFKWTAGVLYGYRDPYEDKVPLNYKGLSPVAIPALAYDFDDRWTGQLNFLGTAALMLQVNRTFR